MSVINKMLKDLEQRDQEQGADFDPSGAVYQAKEKSKLPLLLAAMLVVIIGLAGVVTWLLMGQNKVEVTGIELVSETQNTLEPAQQSDPTPVTEVQTPAPEEQPKVLNQSPVLAAVTTVEPSSNTQAAPEQEPVNTTQQTMLNEEATQVTEQELEDENFFEDEFDSVVGTPEPKQEVEQPQFKIEKSASNLTREQRIEKLMTKAQESFDKGYISDAISQLEEVLGSADNHVEARNLLAVAWYGRGELQQAVNILNDGLSRYPNTEKWRLTAAKIFFKENEQQGAFTYLEADLVDASPEYYSMQGTLARQLKRFDKAEVAYANLTKIEPEKGNWWLGYAIALDSQNKSQLAKQSYQQAVNKAGISPSSIKFAKQRIAKLQD